MTEQELIEKIANDRLSIKFINLEEKKKPVEFFESMDFLFKGMEGFEEGYVEYYDEEELSEFESASRDVMTFQEFLKVIEPKK